MSVVLTFEPSGITGVVAPGTYLVDAARRLGVSLGGCQRNGDSHSCLVRIISGTELLSQRSQEEERVLANGEFDQSYRLACQSKIDNPGELELAVLHRTVGPTANSVNDEDVRKKFGELSLNKKIATLLQLEAITMSEAFDAALEKPLSLGSRAFDSVMKRARSANAQKTNSGHQ